MDKLFETQWNSRPNPMGDNATKDYILRNVFGITVEMIRDEVELLRALLRLHYEKTSIPQTLSNRLVQMLKTHDDFNTWPLETIIPDTDAFFAFLQERWPLFLSRYGQTDQIGENYSKYGIKFPGPEILPFDHQDIRVYMDNLFVEGKLTPVQISEFTIDAKSWIRIGIVEAIVNDDSVRISRLFELLEKDPPTLKFRYSDWTAFALRWAELSALVHCTGNEAYKLRLREMGDALNETFFEWLSNQYAGLINLPPTNPAMLHHVPRRWPAIW